MTGDGAERDEVHGAERDEVHSADPGTEMGRDEEAIVAGFDRLRPQGSLRWGFDDAMRRLAHEDAVSAAGAAPWEGLPDDLWERGHSARIGRRFIGDVAGVMADILAADARAMTDVTVSASNGARFAAAWDALRFMAARVDALEAREDPARLEVAEIPVPAPEVGEWADQVVAWVGPPEGPATLVVGEAGDGALVATLAAAGWRVQGVEPRGAEVWESLSPSGAMRDTRADMVFGEVAGHLSTLPGGSVDAVVLAGCVDRLDLAAKLGLLRQSVRVTRTGGSIVLFAMDQPAWDAALAAPARDLLPGRPLHPETWSLLFRRYGAADVAWHRPRRGHVHAVVARMRR